MKIQALITIVLATLAVNGAVVSTKAPATPTNILAIYLVADQVPQVRLLDRTASPDDLKLAPTPVLADADFVSCTLTNERFVITPAAAIKVGVTCAFRQVPYVLVANGERIYLGMFDTLASSGGFGLPGTIADGALTDCFMGPDNIPEEVFEAMRQRERVATDALVALAKARPTTNVVLQISTRGDKRIAAAVERLFPKTKH